MTVVIITHNSALTAMADRVIKVKNGKITSNVVNEHRCPLAAVRGTAHEGEELGDQGVGDCIGSDEQNWG